MSKVQYSTKTDKKRARPAATPEARENQMIAMAITAAEEQLRNGTASSQVITHYLKLGTVKSRLELEILEKEKELLVAKTEALKSQKNSEELFAKAIAAMKIYTGDSATVGEEDEELQ